MLKNWALFASGVTLNRADHTDPPRDVAQGSCGSGPIHPAKPLYCSALVSRIRLSNSCFLSGCLAHSSWVSSRELTR